MPLVFYPQIYISYMDSVLCVKNYVLQRNGVLRKIRAHYKMKLTELST